MLQILKGVTFAEITFELYVLLTCQITKYFLTKEYCYFNLLFLKEKLSVPLLLEHYLDHKEQQQLQHQRPLSKLLFQQLQEH